MTSEVIQVAAVCAVIGALATASVLLIRQYVRDEFNR